jgi:hypothetical protein
MLSCVVFIGVFILIGVFVLLALQFRDEGANLDLVGK